MTAQEVNPEGQFTRIHGQWYDVTEFSKIHPGGTLSISFGVSRDSTALFESYHALLARSGSPFKALLDGLRVTCKDTIARLERAFPAATLADGGFDWSCSPTGILGGDDRNTDPFQRDVLEVARSYFSAEAARRGVPVRKAMKATPLRWLQIAVIAFVACAACALLVMGWWPAVVIAPLAIWVLMVSSGMID